MTKSLDNVRNQLRDQCLRNNTPNSTVLKLDLHDQSTENLYESLKIFDRLFSDFELQYVSAMVQVKVRRNSIAIKFAPSSFIQIAIVCIFLFVDKTRARNSRADLCAVL